MHVVGNEKMKKPIEIRWLAAFFSLFVLVPSLAVERISLLTSALPDGLTLLLAGLFSGLLLLVASHRHQLHFSPVLGMLAAFAAAVAVSVLVNSYAYSASWRWYLVFLSVAALLVFALTDLLARMRRISYVRLLAFCLWVGVGVYALASLLRYYGLLQWGGAAWMPSEGRMGGIWAQANLNTTTLWLGVLAATYCSTAKATPVPVNGNKRMAGLVSWPLVLSVLLFGWAIACTASRISWLFAAGLLAMLAVACLKPWRDNGAALLRRRLFVVVLALVVMFFVVPLLNNPLNRVLTDYGLVNRPHPVTLQERDVLHDAHRTTEWKKTLLAISEMPPKELFFGVGAGRYAHFSAAHVGLVSAAAMNAGLWGNAHNLFVMTFVEEGLVGLAVVLFIVLLLIWQVLRRPLNRETLFLLGGVGLLFIHSNLEFPLWYAWFLVLLCLFMLPLFGTTEVALDSAWVKPAAGVGCWLLSLSLLVTLGSSFWTFSQLSTKNNLSQQDYWTLSAMGKSDGLLSPYATLLKYRQFGVADSLLGYQLAESFRMVDWQPRELVRVREYFLLLATKQWDLACRVATNNAWRAPNTAPYMISQPPKRHFVSPTQQERMVKCIKAGLARRGKTLSEVEKSVQDNIKDQWLYRAARSRAQ